MAHDASPEASSATVHPCAAPGCVRSVTDDFLMCAPHWRLVPRDLQVEVYKARHTLMTRFGSVAACPPAGPERAAYEHARREATLAVAKGLGRHRESVCVLLPRGERFAAIRAAKHQKRPELPGGKLEAGETHVEAAQREVREELGAEVTDLRPLLTVDVPVRSRGELHTCVMFVGRIDEDAVLVGSREGPACWVTRDELLTHGTYREFASRAFEALDAMAEARADEETARLAPQNVVRSGDVRHG